MIKTIIFNFLFLVPGIILAQVGINTTTPTHKLDVNGDVLIEKHLIETKNRDISGPFLLYTRSKDTNPVGEVKKLDPTLMNVAPVNRYKVIINNVNQDRVTNVDTGLSASKYFLAIADAKFVGANIGSNPITHPIAGARSEYGTYTNGVSVNAAGNYTISLDFVGAGTQSAANGNWEFILLVYHISLLTDFKTVTTTITGNSGQPAAGTVVDLFN